MKIKNMKKQLCKNLICTGLLVLPLTALAGPEIVLNMVSEKEIMVEENGKQVKKKVEAKETTPGDELIFSITYKNKGDEMAKNIAIKNPIPEGTVYVIDSAQGNNAEITFSIDKGITFKKPGMLTYESNDSAGKSVKSKASYEQYSHVKWLVKEVQPGKDGTVSYKVKVK